MQLNKISSLPGAMVQDICLQMTAVYLAHFTKEKPDCEIIDRTGSWVAPGLLLMHSYPWLSDHDIMDCDPDGAAEIALGFALNGVILWLPTTLTASVGANWRCCLESVADAAEGIAEWR